MSNNEPRILLVEDNPVDVLMVRRALKYWLSSLRSCSMTASPPWNSWHNAAASPGAALPDLVYSGFESAENRRTRGLIVHPPDARLARLARDHPQFVALKT